MTDRINPMKRALISAAAVYAIVAVVTFGHCAAHGKPPECILDAQRQCSGFYRLDDRVPNAVGAMALWPLYWSWEAWS